MEEGAKRVQGAKQVGKVLEFVPRSAAKLPPLAQKIADKMKEIKERK